MTQSADTLLDRIGRFLARRLKVESSGYEPYTPSDPDTLRRTLQPGDVLLVEGNQKVSSAIKYLTQSTWSHSALYVGDALPEPADGSERPRLVEVNLGEGCVAVPLSKYRTYNTRICRPSGLTPEDRDAVVSFMVRSLGLRYDMKNIFDMLRYFFPTPPVPVRWRRRMIAFGSGDPTRSICSSLIAQAYEGVRYPILPEISRTPGHASAQSSFSREEIMHIRHHSLYTPRDFDLSPFFAIVKPTLVYGFDYKQVVWAEKKQEAIAAAIAREPASAPPQPTAAHAVTLSGSADDVLLEAKKVDADARLKASSSAASVMQRRLLPLLERVGRRRV